MRIWSNRNLFIANRNANKIKHTLITQSSNGGCWYLPKGVETFIHTHKKKHAHR